MNKVPSFIFLLMKWTKRTWTILGLALCIQVISLMIWYGALPHQTKWFVYLPYVSLFACGLLIGLFDSQNYLTKTLTLGVFLSIMGGAAHWIAGRLGVPVDLGSASSSAVLAMISMPICIGLNMLGGVIGSWACRFVQRRGASSK